VLARFERYPLTFGPTPIERLDRLSGHLGGAVQIYAKREDCNSGLAFGGNKLRKLEYIVPDAIASGADTLVTIGGIQSNHTRPAPRSTSTAASASSASPRRCAGRRRSSDSGSTSSSRAP
jgi:1-aminocyclopropane-1-carboxylate deaminase/D-cysteine desulfhydrase-like pyridoxal-dependent ACC family enzyme